MVSFRDGVRKKIGEYFNVSSGFVGYFHDELVLYVVLWVEQQVENVQVDGGAQIVDVRYETVLSTLFDKRF